MQRSIAAKLSLLLFFWVCAFALEWNLILPLIGILVVARWTIPFRPVTDRLARAWNKFLLYLLLLFIALMAVNALFIKGGAVLLEFGPLRFHSEGAIFGLATAARVGLLSLATLLMFISTPLKNLVKFLQAWGLSPSIAMVILQALFFVQKLPSRIDQILLAQEARGANVRGNVLARARSLTALLAPLVLSSILESLQRGLALELRGALHAVPGADRERPAIPIEAYVLVLLAIIILLLRFAS